MSTFNAERRTEGRSDPPVKPTSEVAHQPGQQPADPKSATEKVAAVWPPSSPKSASEAAAMKTPIGGTGRPRLCGGVQRGETKSAGETTGGARGGSRLGNPSVGEGERR